MPPKGKLSRSAKQALIVSHLRSTGTCHTLKELEKMLPSVASINGLQVKEYLQELLDDDRVRCEKIGTGNWYWCFGGEERKQREEELAAVRREVERVRGRVQEVEGEIERRRILHAQEVADEGGEEQHYEVVRQELMDRKTRLEGECRGLREEWERHQGSLGVATMERETERWKRETERCTENIYLLEAYVRQLAQGDRDLVQAIQRECYGEEYDVEEGGLRELVFD